MVLSASSVTAFKAYGESYYFVEKQAVGVALGLPALWIASRLPPRVYRMFAYPILLGSIGLLCLVLLPGMGVEVNNNRNWIEIGAFRLQPSEFAKVALIVWGADLLARKRKLLGQPKHVLVPLVPVACAVIGLVLLGDDLGTAVILGTIVLSLLWVAGTPLRIFTSLVLLASVVVLFFIHQQQDRLARLYSFGDPFADFHGTGWQGANGIYALATGGFFGVGLGASRQKWGDLPAAHTDFILAIIGEELGLAGTLVVLALFAALGYAGSHRDPGEGSLRPARGSRDNRSGRWSDDRQPRRRPRLLPIAGSHFRSSHMEGRPAPPSRWACCLPSGPGAGVPPRARRPRPGTAGTPAAPDTAAHVRLTTGATAGARHARRFQPAPPVARFGEVNGMHVVLAGGGTAGHIEPALALADALRREDPTVGITALGTERGLETRLVPERGYELALLPAVPLPRRPTPDLLKVPGARRAVPASPEIPDEVKADSLVRRRGDALSGREAPGGSSSSTRRMGRARRYRIGARSPTPVAVSTGHPAAVLASVGIPLRPAIATLDRKQSSWRPASISARA